MLDVKPYVPVFDAFPGVRAGWLDERRAHAARADGRFEKRAGVSARGEERDELK